MVRMRWDKIWSLDCDHIFDHLRLRTMWNQCLKEHPKAVISDTKVSKITQKPLFYKAFTVWEQVQAGSTPVIPTT